MIRNQGGKIFMKSKKKRFKISTVISLILLIIVTIIYMLPFWMVSTSFKADYELYEYPTLYGLIN